MAETPEYFDNVTVGQYAMTGVPLKVYVTGEYLTITDPDDVENPLIGFGMLPNGEMEQFDYKQIEHLLVSGNVVDLETYKKAMEDDDKEDDDKEEEGEEEEGEEEGGEEEGGANPFESVMPSLASLVEITKDVKKAREKALDAEEDALKDKRKALDDEPITDGVAEARGRAGEELSMISKSRAKASLRQIKKGKRDDGMGKFDAKLYGIDASGDEHEITDEDEINIYKKFGLRSESINEKIYRVYLDGNYEEHYTEDPFASKAKAIAQAKKMARNHKGKIEVTSDEDIDDVVWTNESINEAKWEVLGSEGNFKVFNDSINGKHIVLILGKGKDQLPYPIKVKPSDTPQKLAKRFYQGRIMNIKESVVNEAAGLLTIVNEAANDRFLQSAARNLAKQMRGKSASRTTLKNRLNSMPLANRLKPEELDKIVDYAMQEMGLDEMQMVNKKTGKDITKHMLDYMEKKITKAEFEKLTGLKKDKLKVNESVIGDILIIADENNTYEAFTAELVNQKYLMPDELEDPETKEWLETTYAQVHESISLKSLAMEARKPAGYYEKKFKHLKKKPKYKKGDLVVYVQDLGGPDELSPETSRVKKVSKGLAGFKYDLTNYIQTNDSEILGLAESINEATEFKKGDKVKYIGRTSVFNDLDPKEVYVVTDVVKDGKGGFTIVLNPAESTPYSTYKGGDAVKPEDLELAESVNEDHMGAPYEYDNISEPYSLKVGDMVRNTNPSCPHNGSQGMVKKVIPMPNDVGQLIKYIVMNQGDTYQAGDVLTKTPDQLEVM